MLVMTARSSRYEAIAAELASRIVTGSMPEGARFSCRKLAERFKVSAETVRRAVILLEESGAVSLEAGSGARVLSRLHAGQYLRRIQSHATVEQIQDELQRLLEQRRDLDREIERVTQLLLKYVFCEVNGRGTDAPREAGSE